MKKEYKKGKWVLTHSIQNGIFGVEDFFELKDTVNNVIYPFNGYPKVTDHTKGIAIAGFLFQYTQKDYEEMLDEQVKKLSTD